MSIIILEKNLYFLILKTEKNAIDVDDKSLIRIVDMRLWIDRGSILEWHGILCLLLFIIIDSPFKVVDF